MTEEINGLHAHALNKLYQHELFLQQGRTERSDKVN